MNTRTITKDTTLIEDLTSATTDYEFCVKNGAHLTVILRSLYQKQIDVKANIRLMSAGSSATIIGLVMASDDAVIRLNTMQQQEAHDTTSNLLVKTALYGSASCVIDGGIRVEKKAQKTDAYQRNENLLMSPSAHAESKPSLEILANDVRCTHGATMGPVSEEELWYLSTRGIPRSEAEPLIVAGFFNKALTMIEDEQVRESVWKSIEGAL